MPSRFELAIPFTLKWESGFVDNKEDAGGATNFGVSLRFYRKKVNPNATTDTIRALSIIEAEKLYLEYFWERPNIGAINDQKLATKVFDLGVNCGSSYAIAMLQRAYNSLDSHNHILADGALGPKTLAAINSCDQERLYNALICEASRHYHDIAHNGNNQQFLNGWLRRLEAC